MEEGRICAMFVEGGIVSRREVHTTCTVLGRRAVSGNIMVIGTPY